MKHDSRKGRAPLFQDRGDRLLMDEDVSMVPGSDDWGDEPRPPDGADARSDRAARIARRSRARAGVFDEGYQGQGALPSSDQQRAFFDRMASEQPAQPVDVDGDWSSPDLDDPPPPPQRSTGPIASDDVGAALDNPLFFPPSTPDPVDVPEPVSARTAHSAADPLAGFASGDGGPAHLFDPPTDPFAATPAVIQSDAAADAPAEDFFGAGLEFNSAAEDAERDGFETTEDVTTPPGPARGSALTASRHFSGLTITALGALVVALVALVVVQLRQGGPGQGVQKRAPTTAATVVAEPVAAPAPAAAPAPDPEPVTVPEPPAQPATPQGRLVVQTNKPAAVYVDGKHVGTTPMRPIDLDVGAHSVRLVPTDHRGRSYRQNLRVNAGRGTQIAHDW